MRRLKNSLAAGDDGNLAQMLKEAQTEEVDQMVYLALECCGRNMRELSLIWRKNDDSGVVDCLRSGAKKVEQEFKKVGDLGEIVGACAP